MKNKITKKMMVFLLSFICIFAVAAATSVAAAAQTEQLTIQIVNYPRGMVDPSWGSPALNFVNGWHNNPANMFMAKGSQTHGMAVAYCVQIGVSISTGDTNPQISSAAFLQNYNNGVLTSEQIQTLLGRLFQHGFSGIVTFDMSDEAITELIATQLLVWEIIVGERNPDFSHRAPPASLDRITDTILPNHPLRARIFSHYDRIVAAVRAHSTLPSFMGATHELTWNGSAFSVTLTDANNVLANFNFSSSAAGVTFNRSGNNLTISMTTAPTTPIEITATRTGTRSAIVFWASDCITNKNQIQGLVTVGQPVTDTLTATVQLTASTGSLRIEKTVQGGGSPAGFEFEVRNAQNELIGTFTSGANGQVTIPNLPAGTYTVREINIPAGYEVVGENPLTITVSPNQTAVARFTNRRMEGQIRIEKYNASPAMGTSSLAGAVFEIRTAAGELVETITTDAQGIATSGSLP
ncbi:MAG: SpaA isopeptide-forming pilin-related protein, partial [Oscillospiraceae bacterium]|nr:SpaA isopeptide-forming pilin-related protein [Oscillospiraceae bacterium]